MVANAMSQGALFQRIDELLATQPPAPDVTEHMARHFWMFTKHPTLLTVDRKGRATFFSDSMEIAFWKEWFQHPEIGHLCYSFWMIHHFCIPLCHRNTFTVSGFTLLNQSIRSVALICPKCLGVTSIDYTWFYTLSHDAKPILCCQKRFTYHNLWRTLFWSIVLHTRALELAKQFGHRVVYIPAPDTTWTPQLRVPHRTVRAFSQFEIK